MDTLQLPKGSLPKKSAGVNPIARYRAAYFEGPEASAAPIGHLIVVLFLVGYTIDCKSSLPPFPYNFRNSFPRRLVELY